MRASLDAHARTRPAHAVASAYQPTSAGASYSIHEFSHFYRLRHPCKTRVFDVRDKPAHREMARLKRIGDKSLMPKF